MLISALYVYPIFMMIAVWNLIVNGSFSGSGDLDSGLFLATAFVAYYTVELILNGLRGRHLLSPESFFVLFFSLFHFGYLILYFFGLGEYEAEVFYNVLSLENSINYSLACVCFFITVYRAIEFPRQRSIDASMSSRPELDDAQSQAVFSVSKILLVFSFLLFWIPVIPVAPIVLSDYRSLISIGEISPLGRFFWLGQYVGYCAIALFLTGKHAVSERLSRGWAFYLLILYVLSYLLTGDRGGFISYFVIIVFYYSFSEKRISLATAGSTVLLLLAISAMVAVGRGQSAFNPIEMVRIYIDSGRQSPLVDALTEFGLSIKTVVIAMYYVPERYPFWFGASFVDSLLIAIPNPFGFRVSSGLGVFITEVAFGPIDSTHGRGGSIAMESYLNFGYFGIVLFGVYAVYLKKIFLMYMLENSLLVSVVFYASIGAFALWMRNTSGAAFRIIVWSFVLSKIISYIYSRRRV